MNSVEILIKDIKNKKLNPIYFLAGEESFYIDQITNIIEENSLTEEEKGFNQTIIYGQDTSIAEIIAIAKQFPMGSERSLLVVKEAQHLSRSIDQLDCYIQQIQPTTILVVNYKGKNLDKRTKLYKSLNQHQFYYEFKKLYDNQIPDWIEEKVLNNNRSIEQKAKFLITEFVGTDLSRLNNELEKLFSIVLKNEMITSLIVEKNIGISKDYNTFELRKSIEIKDLSKSFKIIKYFEKNPKNYPIQAILPMLFNLFTQIMIYHTLVDKSKANVTKELGIHPFFVKDIDAASRNYPLKKVTRIISFIREYDLKSKGVNSSSNVSSSQLLIELIFKINNL